MRSDEDAVYFTAQAKGEFEEALQRGEITPASLRKLLNLPEESLVSAIDAITEERMGLSEGETEYLVFLVNLRRYHHSWHDPKAEGSLWSIIGEREGPTLALVETSEKRRVGDFGVMVYSKGDFDGKYPGNLKRIFESMEADEMTVKYTDEEYAEKYGIGFSGSFKIRNPTEGGDGAIGGLVGVVSSLIGFEDPLSMTPEERVEGVDLPLFFASEMRDVFEAFERMHPPEMSLLQKDLFEFVTRVKGLYNMWEEDLGPFNYFEEGESKKMLRVDFGPTHEGGSPRMTPVTADFLRESLERDGDFEPFRLSLEHLENDFVDEGMVVIVFFDGFMTNRHGFPFDMSIPLERA